MYHSIPQLFFDNTVNMKAFLKYLFAVTFAAFAFVSCEEPEPVEEHQDPVKYVLTGDSAFTNLKASVKVTADKAAQEDVSVAIKLDEASDFPAGTLSYTERLQIKKGDTEAVASAEIIKQDALDPGKEYKAVFMAEVAGAALAQKVSITYTRPDLNGKWSVIGIGGNWNDDIPMAEAENGWYSSEGVIAVAGDCFKFRRDGKWDLAYGIKPSGIAPLDTEFNVVTDPGETNIGIEKEGVYSLYLNPNKAIAKVVRTGAVAVTIAGLKALAPKEISSEEKVAFEGNLSFTVTLVPDASSAIVQDQTGGILISHQNHGWTAGTVVTGDVSGKVTRINGQRVLCELDLSKVEAASGNAPEPKQVTVAQILERMDEYENTLVKLEGLKNEGWLSQDANPVFQGKDKIILFINQETALKVEPSSSFDVVAVPYTSAYSTNLVKIWSDDAISNVKAPTKAMSVERLWGYYNSQGNWDDAMVTTRNEWNRSAVLTKDKLFVAIAGSADGQYGVAVFNAANGEFIETITAGFETDSDQVFRTCGMAKLGDRIYVSNLARNGQTLRIYELDVVNRKADKILSCKALGPKSGNREDISQNLRLGDKMSAWGNQDAGLLGFSDYDGNGYIEFRIASGVWDTAPKYSTGTFERTNNTSQIGGMYITNAEYGAAQGERYAVYASNKEVDFRVTWAYGQCDYWYGGSGYWLSRDGATEGNMMDPRWFWHTDGNKYLAYVTSTGTVGGPASGYLKVVKMTGDTWLGQFQNIVNEKVVWKFALGSPDDINAKGSVNTNQQGFCDVYSDGEGSIFIAAGLSECGISIFRMGVMVVE